jgi:antitoxin component of MazEF toxin-antitoxin module
MAARRKVVTLEIANDGTLTIPADLTRVLQLSPHQTVTVEAQENILILKPSRKERLNRIKELLRTTLAGVKWSDIEAQRQNRCF